MSNTPKDSIQLDPETRNQEIVSSLRGFLKHQTAFKEYVAKRMTPEEYATICRIVTEGFVELSVEILALEAHLGGPAYASKVDVLSAPTSTTGSSTTATVETANSSSTEQSPSNVSERNLSLDSPEYAQLIRDVQMLEKQKLALTVQGQKLALEKESRETQDIRDQEAELQADRVVGDQDEDTEHDVAHIESQVQATAVHDVEGSLSPQPATIAIANGGIKLSVEELQAKIDENRNRHVPTLRILLMTLPLRSKF
ncbi:hypothetical protein FBU30_005354 [Linnemannia zychae]|nr:hypothetical protein FBU30_005354 [Linnemannia zychae]